MAYIKCSDGTSRNCDRVTSENLFKVLTGGSEEDIEAVALAETTSKLYMAWRKAPDEYLLAKKQTILPMLLSLYVVNSEGVPLHPEPNDTDAWRISYLYNIIPESVSPKEFVMTGYTGRMV